MPEVASRLSDDGSVNHVDVLEIGVGDRVLVSPGEIIPADGVIVNGATTIDESILTGESSPVFKKSGDAVVAGSINIENGIRVRVNRTAQNTALSRIVHLTDSAQSAKPKVARIADKIAGKFVLGVLLLTLFACGYWWFRDSSILLPVVISTLVVACPCALSLATPTAFVATMNLLTKRGIIPIRGEFLEDITNVTHIVFDKTGTLTKGALSLNHICTAPNWNKAQVTQIATALNLTSKHPFADAFRDLPGSNGKMASQVSHTAGGGIAGTINGKQFTIGSLNFIKSTTRLSGECEALVEARKNQSVCYLANEGKIIARFEFSDQLRSDAHRVIKKLRQGGLSLLLLSGDNHSVVSNTAQSLGIDQYKSNLSPSEKQTVVKHLQHQGAKVAVVGDGLNDAPVLASADVSIAMGQGADLSKINADVVLLNNRLSDLLDITNCANRTSWVIRQNLMWAIGYNLLAIPAALAGIVPPWLAAIGMSTSSLIVSLNATRLLSHQPHHKLTNWSP